MSKPFDPYCVAFQSAIDILGRQWTALILGMLQEGPLRFGELVDRSHGGGAKILSARLKELDARGIVARTVEPGPPVRVMYALTAKGRAFGQVARSIERWGRVLVGRTRRVRSPQTTIRRPR